MINIIILHLSIDSFKQCSYFKYNNLRLASVIAIFKEPFCSLLSTTFQNTVPYETPKHTHYLVTGLLIYCKKVTHVDFNVHQALQIERRYSHEVVN